MRCKRHGLLRWLTTAGLAVTAAAQTDPAEPVGPTDPRVDTSVESGDSALFSLDTTYPAYLTRPDALLETDQDRALNRLHRALATTPGALVTGVTDPLSPFGTDFPLYGFIRPGATAPASFWAASGTSDPVGISYGGLNPWSTGATGAAPFAGSYGPTPGGAGVRDWRRPGGTMSGSLLPTDVLAAPSGAPWPNRYATGRPSFVVPPAASWTAPAGANYTGSTLPPPSGLGFDLTPGLNAIGGLDLRLPEGATEGLPGHAWQATGLSPSGVTTSAAATTDLTSADLILAEAAMTRGDFTMAEQIYGRILILSPGNTSARCHRAVALFALGSYDEAAVEIYAAFQNSRQRIDDLRVRAVMADATLLETRRQTLTTLVEQHATGERMLLRAYIEAACGRRQAALADVRRATSLDPNIGDLPAVRSWQAALEGGTPAAPPP